MKRSRLLTLLGWALVSIGAVFIVAVYLDGLLVDHQFYFFATEQYELAVAASVFIVGGLNAFAWRRALKSPLTRGMKLFVALLLAGSSLIACWLLVLILFVTAPL